VKDSVSKATKLFKNVQGYMGDRQLSFPVMLLRELLKAAIKTPDLRDEIYLQIIKQLTNNLNPDSTKKGWQLMLSCLMTFPPSSKFENYLAIWLKTEGTLTFSLSTRRRRRRRHLPHRFIIIL